MAALLVNDAHTIMYSLCLFSSFQGMKQKGYFEKCWLPSLQQQRSWSCWFFEVVKSQPDEGGKAVGCHVGEIAIVAAPVHSERQSGMLKYVREKTCWQIDGECWPISVNHNKKGVNQDQEENSSSWGVAPHLQLAVSLGKHILWLGPISLSDGFLSNLYTTVFSDKWPSAYAATNGKLSQQASASSSGATAYFLKPIMPPLKCTHECARTHVPRSSTCKICCLYAGLWI